MRALLIVLAVALAGELGMRLAGRIYLDRFYKSLTCRNRSHIHIVCLGESSTAGLWVSEEQSYPKQLEAQLQSHYENPRIHVLIPPHVGQNSSQMANRIDDYVERYHPRLVIAMVGVNNAWSLAESHIVPFIEGGAPWWMRVRIGLDEIRLFRLVHTLYFLVARHTINGHELLGQPAKAVRAWAIEKQFAREHAAAFAALWRYDVTKLVEGSRRGGARFLLMTYHIDPSYLTAHEYLSLSTELKVPLVRNDLPFAEMLRSGKLDEYLFSDHWHPNERGYRIIADDAFQSIIKDDLLGLGAH
jgi:lysophospholipase L1-like esterase